MRDNIAQIQVAAADLSNALSRSICHELPSFAEKWGLVDDEIPTALAIAHSNNLAAAIVAGAKLPGRTANELDAELRGFVGKWLEQLRDKENRE